MEKEFVCTELFANMEEFLGAERFWERRSRHNRISSTTKFIDTSNYIELSTLYFEGAEIRSFLDGETTLFFEAVKDNGKVEYVDIDPDVKLVLDLIFNKPSNGMVYIEDSRHKREEKEEYLSKKILDRYDYIKLKNKVSEVLGLFEYVQSIDPKIPIPKITTDYRIRYEQFKPIYSSAIENFVVEKMMLELKGEEARSELFTKISKALRQLNIREKKVFNFTFFEKKSEEDIMEAIHYR